MFRFLSLSIAVAAIISMSGCVLGPMHGGGAHCNSCDGYSGGGAGVYGRPGDSFRQWRKSLTCGAGCGETYYDEWYSSPPDCEDPCPQFAGSCGGNCGGGCGGPGCLDTCGCGSSSCGGGCGFQPLRTVGAAVAGLYGKRFCGACGYNYDDCSCGGGGYPGDYIGGDIIDGGCSSGTCNVNSNGQTRMAASQPKSRRSVAHQQMVNRQQIASANQLMGQRNYQVQPERAPQGNANGNKFYRHARLLPSSRDSGRR